MQICTAPRASPVQQGLSRQTSATTRVCCALSTRRHLGRPGHRKRSACACLGSSSRTWRMRASRAPLGSSKTRSVTPTARFVRLTPTVRRRAYCRWPAHTRAPRSPVRSPCMTARATRASTTCLSPPPTCPFGAGRAPRRTAPFSRAKPALPAHSTTSPGRLRVRRALQTRTTTARLRWKRRNAPCARALRSRRRARATPPTACAGWGTRAVRGSRASRVQLERSATHWPSISARPAHLARTMTTLRQWMQQIADRVQPTRSQPAPLAANSPVSVRVDTLEPLLPGACAGSAPHAPRAATKTLPMHPPATLVPPAHFHPRRRPPPLTHVSSVRMEATLWPWAPAPAPCAPPAPGRKWPTPAGIP